MTRCDPRIVRCIREAASGKRQSDPYMARVAVMLGLIERGRNDNRLWPTSLGVEVERAMHGVV